MDNKVTSGEKSAYQAEQIEIPSLNWTYTCPWKLHLHYTFNKRKNSNTNLKLTISKQQIVIKNINYSNFSTQSLTTLTYLCIRSQAYISDKTWPETFGIKLHIKP